MSAKISPIPEAKPEEPKRKMPLLSPNDFKPAEFVRTQYFAIARPGNVAEDIGEPEFYSHMAHILRPYDEIFVLDFDQLWYGRVFILDVENGSVVRPLIEKIGRLPELATPSGPVLPENFKMTRSPKGYEVRRISDDTDFGVHETPTAAILHVRNHASQRPK